MNEWKNEYDDKGRLVAMIYGNDPNNPDSWWAKYDADGWKKGEK